MGDMKQSTHRERERGTKNVYINNMATITKWQQPLLKVTKSHYIVTHLEQLPFRLFTQMARTWAIKEDSVNTSIIHWYSTLGRNGRIHGLSKNTGINKRFSDRSVLFESARSESRRPNLSGRKSWSRSSVNRCRLSETILRYVRLQPDQYVLTPICCQRDRNWSAERHLVIPSSTLSIVDIFSKPIFSEMTQSRTKWYRTSKCLEALWWPSPEKSESV